MGDAFNLIVRDDIGNRFSLGVDPAGTDACVDAALNVGSQTIAHDDGLFLLEAFDPGKDSFKVGDIRLICPTS